MIDALKHEGFGILTDIDVAATMKAKLGDGFSPLPRSSARATRSSLIARSRLRTRSVTMLPCNVIVQQHLGGGVEVSAVDPVASMQAIDNPGLADVANEVHARLKHVVASL